MTELPPFGLIEIAVLLGLVGVVIVAVILFRGRAGGPLGRSGKDAETGRQDGQAFDDRLRRLEALRREGVLSHGEYRRKRDEILGQKW